MLKALFASLASTVFIAACGAAETAKPVEPPEIQASTAVQASGLLTANPVTAQAATDAAGRPLGYAWLGQKLPAFTAPMADGSVFDSAAITRWTVIAVWGAWSSESVADAPYVEALSRAIAADPDLDFVTLHVPASAAQAAPEEMFGEYGSLEAYFASAGYTLPVALDTDAGLREALKISWTPSYLLVSPDRVVRGFRTDLSLDKDQPIKNFIKDIARIRSEVRDGAVHVMPLGAGTPFTVAAVEKAFPGHSVIPITDPATGGVTFEVRANGSDKARFIVEPDWTRGYVATVRSRDPATPGPLGEIIGQAALGQISAEDRARCKDTEPGLLVCPDPASPATLARVYKLASGAAPESSAVLLELRYFIPAP